MPATQGAKVNSAWWGNSGAHTITQIFGVWEDLIINGVHISQPHTGIDIDMPTGTKLYTPAHAHVDGAGIDGYGNKFVRLVMDNGDKVLLLHLDSIAVSNGQDLQGGTLLGTSGMSGLATAPHLHFEVDQGASNTPIDSWNWLNDPGKILAAVGSPITVGGGSGNPLDALAGINDFLQHLVYIPHNPCEPPDNEMPLYKIADAVTCPQNWYKVGFVSLGIVFIGIGVFLYFFKEEVHAAEIGVGTVAGAAAKAA